MIFVVGADGQIGRPLGAALTAAGRDWIASSRRSSAGPHTCFLDLAADRASWQIPHALDWAVLLAGQTNVAACQADPDGTARINVQACAALADRLAGQGTRVLICSTNRVLSGEEPRQRADQVAPQDAYGRQKQALEQHLLSLPGSVVLRVAKILQADHPGFLSWLDRLADGQPVEVFSDATIAPVSMDAVMSALLALMTPDRQGRCHAGLFQFSAQDDVTYLDALRYLADRCGLDGGLIRGKAAPPGLFAPFSSLDVGALTQAIKIAPPASSQSLDAIADLWLHRRG